MFLGLRSIPLIENGTCEREHGDNEENFAALETKVHTHKHSDWQKENLEVT